MLLSLYSQLLRLYPSSYRQEYADEMIETMRIMLSETRGINARFNLFLRMSKDYIASMTEQNLLAFETAASEAPQYVLRSSEFSVGLVIPFFIICVFNWLNLYVFHLSAAYVRWEAKTWIVYCIVLPFIAGLIIFLAGLTNIIRTFRDTHSNNKLQWSLLIIPLSLLVIMVLM